MAKRIGAKVTELPRAGDFQTARRAGGHSGRHRQFDRLGSRIDCAKPRSIRLLDDPGPCGLIASGLARRASVQSMDFAAGPSRAATREYGASSDPDACARSSAGPRNCWQCGLARWPQGCDT